MSELDDLRRDLVIANRILAHQGVVDGFGHVSARHPDNPERFLLSRSRSPELVTLDDIREFDLSGEMIDPDGSTAYLERFIHAAVYELHPEVNGCVHSHSEALLPFGITSVPLRPVFHNASRIGKEVPVWDIADKFGDATDMLVVNMDHGRDLAETLGDNRLVLMRGHGLTVATEALHTVVTTAIYAMVNARVQTTAMQMGEVKFLSEGELDAAISKAKTATVGHKRIWEYLSRRAGCEDL
ncbi:MAG: class II aldolase/adducin family protein [Alphaproteobacteria bacterium]|nr:class II aldolase/adducin family protein [Alphaproteobacteria bacterium]